MSAAGNDGSPDLNSVFPGGHSDPFEPNQPSGHGTAPEVGNRPLSPFWDMGSFSALSPISFPPTSTNVNSTGLGHVPSFLPNTMEQSGSGSYLLGGTPRQLSTPEALSPPLGSPHLQYSHSSTSPSTKVTTVENPFVTSHDFVNARPSNPTRTFSEPNHERLHTGLTLAEAMYKYGKQTLPNVQGKSSTTSQKFSRSISYGSTDLSTLSPSPASKDSPTSSSSSLTASTSRSRKPSKTNSSDKSSASSSRRGSVDMLVVTNGSQKRKASKSLSTPDKKNKKLQNENERRQKLVQMVEELKKLVPGHGGMDVRSQSDVLEAAAGYLRTLQVSLQELESRRKIALIGFDRISESVAFLKESLRKSALPNVSYQSLFNESNAGIMHLRYGGTILYMNQNIKQMIGISMLPDGMASRLSLKQFIHPAEAAMWTWCDTFSIVPQGIRDHGFEPISSTVFDDKGKEHYVVGACSELSDRSCVVFLVEFDMATQAAARARQETLKTVLWYQKHTSHPISLSMLAHPNSVLPPADVVCKDPACETCSLVTSHRAKEDRSFSPSSPFNSQWVDTTFDSNFVQIPKPW